MLTAARLPLDPTTHGGIRREARCWRISQSRKLWATRLLLGFTGRLPDRASFGCALRFVPAPATLDAPAQDFGFVWSPIAWKLANNFDRAVWHAPAGLKSDDDSAKITAQ